MGDHCVVPRQRREFGRWVVTGAIAHVAGDGVAVVVMPADYTPLLELANYDGVAASVPARRWRQYSITPGMSESTMMARITREKFCLTNGKLPKK